MIKRPKLRFAVLVGGAASLAALCWLLTRTEKEEYLVLPSADVVESIQASVYDESLPLARVPEFTVPAKHVATLLAAFQPAVKVVHGRNDWDAIYNGYPITPVVAELVIQTKTGQAIRIAL